MRAIIGCELDVAVVRANPHHRRIERRRRDGVDDAALAIAINLRGGGGIERGWRAGIGAREVRTDLCPALRGIHRLEKKLARVVHRVAVGL